MAQHPKRMAKINLAGRKVAVPGHPWLRKGLGVGLIIGGLLGFLPVLGFWMIPVGLAVLSIDSPAARRLHRRVTVGLGLWLNRRWPALARKLGYNGTRSERDRR